MKKILSVFRRAGDAVNNKIYHYAAIGAADARVTQLGRRFAFLGVLGAAAMAVSEPSMAESEASPKRREKNNHDQDNGDRAKFSHG